MPQHLKLLFTVTMQLKLEFWMSIQKKQALHVIQQLQ